MVRSCSLYDVHTQLTGIMGLRSVSQRRGALKTINVDAPPSDDEFIEAAGEEHEDRVNEDGEDEDGKDELEDEVQDDGEEPEFRDEGVLDNLAAEVCTNTTPSSASPTVWFTHCAQAVSFSKSGAASRTQIQSVDSAVPNSPAASVHSATETDATTQDSGKEAAVRAMHTDTR